MQLYEVWLWISKVPFSLNEADVSTLMVADDPLEAVFRVMREQVVSHAALAEVFFGDEFIAEYADIVCPEQEVC